MASRAVSIDSIQAGYRVALQGIGKRITDARREKALSQVVLAQKLAVSRGTLALWEMGDVIPQMPALCLLAEHLNVSVNWLIFGAGTPTAGSVEDRAEVPITMVRFDGDEQVPVNVLMFPKAIINTREERTYANLFGAVVDSDLVSPQYRPNDIVIFNAAQRDPLHSGNFLYRSGKRVVICKIIIRFGEKLLVEQGENSFEASAAEIAPYLLGKVMTHIRKD